MKTNLLSLGCLLASTSCVIASTPPGTLITLVASVKTDSTDWVRVEKQIVVVSPAAYPRPIYVCPTQRWIPAEPYDSRPPRGWTVGQEATSPLGTNVVRNTDTLANGWRVKRGTEEGIQLTDGSLFVAR